ncbi:MAG: UDP-N-acetylmuramoyl-L-alanyl-D-glutamate--2,6-diaminopimelate ligase [Deltaproteobacteria bacterium]|nr:UDP-N-acetylmuramoyl-L-alanyl-D-glutamate--2,6-diaminopimelate ligase [Deltaproteobacteria bacterium]
MALAEFVRRGVASCVRGDPQVRVRGVHHDSREVEPGDLFVSVPGETADGARFLDDAFAHGAVAVAASSVTQERVPTLLVRDPRVALGASASLLYGEPTRALATVGITGTNGKTTTGHLVEDILRAAGHRPAFLGTTAFRAPGVERQIGFTTPEGDAIARLAAEALERGASHLVMEVSSHGLALHRADACHFRVAAFTNLTQDHLDFHADMQDYARAKARLFSELSVERSVINVDDAFGAELAAKGGDVIRVSRREGADVWSSEASVGRDGISARVHTPKGDLPLRSPLLGDHNLENLLLAVGIAVALEVPLDAISAGLRASLGAPGRLEPIPNTRELRVLVDYAHTPDALAHALAALRPLTPGRLWVIFGCGGDRDRAKRPHMGREAARAADLLLVTSDNPRTEEPRAIVDEILPGVLEQAVPALSSEALAVASRGYRVELDRRRAIALAIASARAGDTLLIAGKGHEDYQIIGRDRVPFDDRVEALAALRGLT